MKMLFAVAPWVRRTKLGRIEDEVLDRSVAKKAGAPNRCGATRVVERRQTARALLGCLLLGLNAFGLLCNSLALIWVSLCLYVGDALWWPAGPNQGGLKRRVI